MKFGESENVMIPWAMVPKVAGHVQKFSRMLAKSVCADLCSALDVLKQAPMACQLPGFAET